MSNPCEGCGSCCKTFTLSKPMDKLVQSETGRSLEWLNELVKLSFEDAWNSGLLDLGIKDLTDSEEQARYFKHWESENVEFFKCNLQDPITGLCTDYDNRPNVCVNFPSQDSVKKGKDHIFKECNLFDLISEEITQ